MTTDSTVQPSIAYAMVRPPGLPTVYVEGLHQIMVGFPNSRLTLYSSSERDLGNPAQETRHLACELVLPTSSLIEMAQIILKSLQDNKALLQTAKTEWIGKLDALTNSIQTPESPNTE